MAERVNESGIQAMINNLQSSDWYAAEEEEARETEPWSVPSQLLEDVMVFLNATEQKKFQRA